MFTVGIIPARKGSKGVERKNVRNLGNFPLIHYTICCAKKSKKLNSIYVTTNDEKVKNLSKKMECLVIDRPENLAQDNTPMLPVIKHAIAQIEKNIEKAIDIVSLLQPTVPFRSPEDVDIAIAKLISTSADSVIGVVQVFDHHPMRMYRIIDGFLSPYSREPEEGYLRQKLPPVYLRNGAIYTFWRDLILKENSMFGNNILPYIMPPERSINIDAETDFIFAEAILKKYFPYLREGYKNV